MNIKDIFKLVTDSKTEADLSHNWLVYLLNQSDPQQVLKRRWEKKNQKGRCDLALSYNGREVCIVETKKPDIKDLPNHFTQAHRYAFAQNYWRSGKMVPVLGILTNGLQAIIFDGATTIKDSFKSKVLLDLTNPFEIKKFCEIFKFLSKGQLGHSLHSAPVIDKRHQIVDELSKELLNYYHKFIIKYPGFAFDFMLQMFLVAVLRDCGYIPTEKMQECYDTGKWKILSLHLNKMLNSAFHPLPNGRKTIIETVYQETTTLCARLDRVPPDCLGLVYETVLHKINKKSATTSYYTPHELALEIIEKVDPKPDELLFDPSCGSGTCLTAAIDYITSKYPDMRLPKKLFSYVTKHLCGVDRDINACNVAKTMVLASVAAQLDFDPASRDLVLPDLSKTIIHKDLFLFEKYYPRKKADVIVGNLPWGHVDGKRKDEILDPKVRAIIKLKEYQSYYRNVDISSIALEHIRGLFIKRGGRIGLLIKQQSLYAKDSEYFRDYAKKAGIKFWDYGSKMLFENRASLAGVAWVGTGQKVFIEKKYESIDSFAKKGALLTKYGYFFMGFQSSANKVYEEWAKRSPESILVKKIYPASMDSLHFILPRAKKIMAFIPTGSVAPQEFIDRLLPDEKKILESRAQVAEHFKYSWRGNEGIEYYKFNNEQMRIVFAWQFTCGEHMRAMLDTRGERIPITSHTVFIPKEDCPEWVVYSILGWLNSKYLLAELEQINATRLADGGYQVNPASMNNVRIPLEVLNKLFAKQIKDGLENGDLTVDVVDQLIEKSCAAKRKAA